VVVIVWQLDFQLSMQSVCDNVFNDLRQVVGFFPGCQASSTNKTDRNDIAEILLTVT
jgi:hypothetical protein